MQETVKYQMEALKDDLYEGDVILTNHPLCGGSHLPDLTVITPVFSPNQGGEESGKGGRSSGQPVFFVASRYDPIRQMSMFFAELFLKRNTSVC